MIRSEWNEQTRQPSAAAEPPYFSSAALPGSPEAAGWLGRAERAAGRYAETMARAPKSTTQSRNKLRAPTNRMRSLLQAIVRNLLFRGSRSGVPHSNWPEAAGTCPWRVLDQVKVEAGPPGDHHYDTATVITRR